VISANHLAGDGLRRKAAGARPRGGLLAEAIEQLNALIDHAVQLGHEVRAGRGQFNVYKCLTPAARRYQRPVLVPAVLAVTLTGPAEVVCWSSTRT
jgi:hypothetical protein